MQYKTEIRWGIIMAVGLFLFQWLLKILGFHGSKIEMHPYVTMIGYLIILGSVLMAMLERRKLMEGGKISYRHALLSGCLTALMSLPVQVILTFVLLKFLSPDFFENAIQMGLEKGFGTEEELRNYFNMGAYLTQLIIGVMATGVIISLILALFVKKK